MWHCMCLSLFISSYIITRIVWRLQGHVFIMENKSTWCVMHIWYINQITFVSFTKLKLHMESCFANTSNWRRSSFGYSQIPVKMLNKQIYCLYGYHLHISLASKIETKWWYINTHCLVKTYVELFMDQTE